MEHEKIYLNLVGQDGNAFNVLGQLRAAAKRAGWDKSEIDSVVKRATAGDYDNLLATILEYCTPELEKIDCE